MTDEEIDAAVRTAKIQAGLDPTQKYLPKLYVDRMSDEAQRAFWARQADRVLTALVEEAEREATA